MIVSKPHRGCDEFVVKILDGSDEIDAIIIRNTKGKIELEGKEYYKFQIAKPKGYEKEEIFHRKDRGYEALLSVVFMTLAEATRKAQKRNTRVQAKNQK